jgi:accessory colonization factor AcfC
MKRIVLIVQVLFLAITFSHAQNDTIYVYGPGGPYPPIRELSEMFQQENNVKIVVTKGPANNWIQDAKSKAHLIYSGSEFMMTSFLNQLTEELSNENIEPLYFRKSGLLVRPGNPKGIKKLDDLLNPDLKILVIHGSGLTGVWEDILGQTRDIEKLKAMRKNINYYAENSAEAKKLWINNPEIDVWITWNIWQVANAELADFVELEEEFTLYRDCGLAITENGKGNIWGNAFFDYLLSEKAKPVFEKWGWTVD